MGHRRPLYTCARSAGLLLVVALLTAPGVPIRAALSSSQEATGIAGQGAALETYFVSPQTVDPASAGIVDSHFVAFDPGATSQGQLFVYLGGYLATSADATLIVKQAATDGFPAIGLAYAKPAQIVPLCQPSPEDGCYEAERRAVIYGGNGTAPLDVVPADSIVNQLSKLLAYLAAQHPDQGWDAYLDNGAPRWSSIRLGGHSEGGTHATLIAQDQEAARLCVFEAPLDLIGRQGGLRRLAPWIEAGGATPADRIYGFRHLHTSSPQSAGFEGAWGLLGLDAFGPAADVDSMAPPYNGSHLLTPKTASGEPLFAPVWQYACLS